MKKVFQNYKRIIFRNVPKVFNTNFSQGRTAIIILATSMLVCKLSCAALVNVRNYFQNAELLPQFLRQNIIQFNLIDAYPLIYYLTILGFAD